MLKTSEFQSSGMKRQTINENIGEDKTGMSKFRLLNWFIHALKYLVHLFDSEVGRECLSLTRKKYV